MKKVVLMLIIMVIMFSIVGCKSHFQDILDNCEIYAKAWQKKGMKARYMGWNPEEQKHYVIFADPKVDGSLIEEYKYHVSFYNGHVVYMYHKKIQKEIYYKYC